MTSQSVRRFAGIVSSFVVFAGIAGAQVGSRMACVTNVTLTQAMRAESLTEATGDITLSCTGGTVPVSGSSIPLANISILYSTNVTSRLIPTPGSNATSEALLLIDEPGSGLPGYGQSLPQVLCTTPLAGCAAAVGAVSGPTLNTAVLPGTSTPAPNVYQGIVSGNAVTFYGVPVLNAGAGAPRVFRITNVRLNAQLLAGGDATLAVPAWISISGAASLALSNPSPNVGFVMSGLATSIAGAASFSRYSSQTKTSAAILTFTENFGAAFKTRVAAQSNNLYAGQIQNPVQNTPGAVYNSESGFVLPVNGTQFTGLTDFGTRLKATFNNVPAGVRVFVSTANVNSNDSPLAAPNPIGGSQANSALGAYTGYAVLVNNESAIDGNAAGGAFPAVIATDSGPGSAGIVPIAEVLINSGTGSAIWEVVNTNPNTIENFKFAVYTTYTSNPAQGSLPDGTTVNLSFAPSSAAGDARDSASPLPRFAPPSGSALPVFNLCTTSSCLVIANTHVGSFMQGQSGATYSVVVSNQAGANPTSGTVTAMETPPAGLTLVSMSGSGWACNTNVCTRSDALAGGASYPPIVVTVNVAPGASSQVINQVTVSGGGSATATASDLTAVITLASPVLSLSKTHAGVFSQGQSGAYAVTVWNQAGAGPTSGTVTVTESLPAGLTLALMYGSGWACAGNTCSRSDALAGGASYPVINVIVNVAANATSPQVNAVSVSGGGAADAGATDPAAIVGGSLLTCTSYVSVTPELRGEGFTELTGDIAIVCNGGSSPAQGSAIPAVDITVTYNTNVTSRLLPRTAPQASNYTSEALLIIDEPGSGLSGYGPSLPQKLCTAPLTGCPAFVGAVSGPTLNTAVSSGSTPAPNVYQGVVNGNSVTFFGVPALPPDVAGARVFRITNVRVNAQPLAAGPQSGRHAGSGVDQRQYPHFAADREPGGRRRLRQQWPYCRCKQRGQSQPVLQPDEDFRRHADIC